MKTTKQQLKQIIIEEVKEILNPDSMEEGNPIPHPAPVKEGDVPNEAVYPAIIAGFTEVLNNHLGQYNFYQQLNNIAEYYAKNFEGGEQAEPKEEEEDDFTDWEPESEYIERWAREQGIPEDEF